MTGHPSILVLGIGNLLWADEGFGVRCAEALAERGADILLMDCMGFVERHRQDAATAGLPVILSNALIAKIHPRRRFLLTKAEMETLNDRLRTLQAKKGYAIPKGMDPNRPQKISRRAMRGR